MGNNVFSGSVSPVGELSVIPKSFAGWDCKQFPKRGWRFLEISSGFNVF